MKILLKAQASFYLFSVSFCFANLRLTTSRRVLAVWSGRQLGMKAVRDEGDGGSWWTQFGFGCPWPALSAEGRLRGGSCGPCVAAIRQARAPGELPGSVAKPSAFISTSARGLLREESRVPGWGFWRGKGWATQLQWVFKEVVWLLSQTEKMHSRFRAVP